MTTRDRILLPWRLPFLILGMVVHLVAFALLAVLLVIMFRPRDVPDLFWRYFG